MDLPGIGSNRKNGIANAMRQAIAAASFFLYVFAARAHVGKTTKKPLDPSTLPGFNGHQIIFYTKKPIALRPLALR